MKTLKEWKIKENYLDCISDTCAACSKEFRNTWSLYEQKGNYCELCNKNAGHLSEHKHAVEILKEKIRDASRAGEDLSKMASDMAFYEGELRKAKKYFPHYIEDLGRLFA